MELKFANEELNKSHEILTTNDCKVILPASAGGYKGPISGIRTAQELEGMIERGSNLVKRKAGSPTPKTGAAASTGA
jgi:hypothetical protein